MKEGRKEETEACSGQGIPGVLTAAALIVLLALRGLAVMIFGMEPSGDTSFCDMAVVTESGAIPFTGHGATDIYVCFLSVLFRFLGNKPEIAVAAQLAMQAGAVLLFFLAVRKRFGRETAVFFLLIGFILPSFWLRYRVISPDLLLCVAAGIVLYAAACLFEAVQRGNKAWAAVTAVFTGILAGVYAWLDISGVVAALLVCAAAGVFAYRAGRDREKAKDVFLAAAPCAVSGMVAFAAALFAQCGMMKTDPVHTAEQYFVNGINHMTYMSYVNLINVVGLFVLCGIGRYAAYICMRNYEARHIKMEGAPQSEGAAKAPEKTQIPAEGEKEMAKESADGSDRAETAVQYIPNPLPLPKRHVKKAIDFDYEPEADQMKFDLELQEGADDFDVP